MMNENDELKNEMVKIPEKNVEALSKYIFEYEKCIKLSNNEIAQKLKKGLWASLSIGSPDSILLEEAIERLEAEEKYLNEVQTLSTELTKELEDKYLLQTTIIDLRQAIQLLFDHIDYTRGACRGNEMVGGVLPVNIIAKVREALLESNKKQTKEVEEE